jgi:hypothetical protein
MSLEHSEVERNRRSSDAQEMTGAGDLPRRAKKRDVHGQL